MKTERDYLAHHYEEVTWEIVWEAVEGMPDLRAAAQALVDSLPADADDDGPVD